MVQKFPNIVALLEYAQENNLYRQLLFQIRKDFMSANISIDLPDNIAPMDLKRVLHEKVYQLIMEKFADYLNLLYIVDVPERVVKAIKAQDVVEISGEVGFEILKREWQKVWFRNRCGS